MRHAESEETRQVRDHDRPITEEGQRAARSVSPYLKPKSLRLAEFHPSSISAQFASI